VFIGIDIGGTNIKAVAVARDGAELARAMLPTDDGAEPGYKTAVPQIVAQLEKDYGAAKGIGISSPGLAARDGRTIVWMMGRMAGVMGFDWTTHLKRPTKVYVLNDAHAALLGEVWLGAAAGKSNVVLLTLGTGVGGAIMCDGRLLKGHLGRAGHLGHLSLNPNGKLDIVNTPGSVEDAIGDCTIERRSDGKFKSTRDLVAAIKTDPHAAKVWHESIRALAAAIASIVNAVDPEIVVLGGGMMAAGEALLGPLQADLDRFEWRPTGDKVRIVPAAMGDFAGAFGAAYNAIHEGKI
jgi:glucokinase